MSDIRMSRKFALILILALCLVAFASPSLANSSNSAVARRTIVDTLQWTRSSTCECPVGNFAQYYVGTPGKDKLFVVGEMLPIDGAWQGCRAKLRGVVGCAESCPAFQIESISLTCPTSSPVARH